MQNCVNLQTLALIRGVSFPEQVTAADGTKNAISVKRGTQTPLAVNFVDAPFGTVQDLGTPLDLRFGAKVAGGEDGSYVVSNYDSDSGLFAYTKTGTGATALYTVRPGWGTAKLNNLLGYDPEGFAETTEIRPVRDLAGSLHQKTVKLYDAAGSVGVWFDLNNAGASVPAEASACSRAIKVTAVNTGDSASVVAQKLAAKLALDSQFAGSTWNNAGLVTVLDSNVGPRTAADASTSGFEVTRWIAGSLPNTMTNVPYVDLEGEWYWDQDGVVSKSQTFTVRVYFDINDGLEGLDDDPADPVFPAPGTLLTTAADGLALKRSVATVANAAESHVVTFPTPFSAAPTTVHAQLMVPSGGALIACAVDHSTITASGFTVVFGAAMPTGTYKLSWLAIAAP